MLLVVFTFTCISGTFGTWSISYHKLTVFINMLLLWTFNRNEMKCITIWEGERALMISEWSLCSWKAKVDRSHHCLPSSIYEMSVSAVALSHSVGEISTIKCIFSEIASKLFSWASLNWTKCCNWASTVTRLQTLCMYVCCKKCCFQYTTVVKSFYLL